MSEKRTAAEIRDAMSAEATGTEAKATISEISDSKTSDAGVGTAHRTRAGLVDERLEACARLEKLREADALGGFRDAPWTRGETFLPRSSRKAP